MPSHFERIQAYQIAALKDTLRHFDAAAEKDLTAGQVLYNCLMDIDVGVDIVWVLRKTKFADSYHSYVDMVGNLSESESYGHFLGNVSEKDLPEIVGAIRAEVDRLAETREDYLTWDGEEGFLVTYRREENGYWLQQIDEVGDVSWVMSL